jgi:hypothetical protein
VGSNARNVPNTKVFGANHSPDVRIVMKRFQNVSKVSEVFLNMRHLGPNDKGNNEDDFIPRFLDLARLLLRIL